MFRKKKLRLEYFIKTEEESVAADEEQGSEYSNCPAHSRKSVRTFPFSKFLIR
jgi:hypothetical protein